MTTPPENGPPDPWQQVPSMTPEQAPQQWAPPPPGYAAPPPGYGAPPAPGAPPPYGAHPPGQYGYGGYQALPRNGLGVAALVLGIVGILSSFFVIGGAFGAAAVVCGVLGRGRAKRGEANNGGTALAGIITGAAAVAVAAVLLVIFVVFFGDRLQSYDECIKRAESPVERAYCNRDFG